MEKVVLTNKSIRTSPLPWQELVSDMRHSIYLLACDQTCHCWHQQVQCSAWMAKLPGWQHATTINSWKVPPMMAPLFPETSHTLGVSCGISMGSLLYGSRDTIMGGPYEFHQIKINQDLSPLTIKLGFWLVVQPCSACSNPLEFRRPKFSRLGSPAAVGKKT